MCNSLNESHIELVEKASDGDLNAMDRIYSLYSKAMLNTSYRIVNTVEDAEDVLQESFMKAFSNLKKFENRSSFGAWLKRIVVNVSIDLVKKRGRFNIISLSDKEELISHPIHNNQNKSRRISDINEALKQLPYGYRTVFSLYHLEGYDHKEISQILQINVSTSISQLSRAKKKLLAIIENRSI